MTEEQDAGTRERPRGDVGDRADHDSPGPAGGSSDLGVDVIHMTSGDQERFLPTGHTAQVSDRTTWRVIFECKHVAWLLDEEHGDGSAWCQQCGEFRCYDDVRRGVPS